MSLHRYIESYGAVYADVADGTATFSISSLDTAVLAVGQGLYSLGGDFYSRQTFLSFDTTAIVSTPSAAVIRLQVVTSSTPHATNVNIAVYDWGGSIDSGDWLDSTALSALTPVGVRAGSLIPDYEHPVYDEVTAFDFVIDPAAINLGGITRLVVYTDDQAAETTPTDPAENLDYEFNGDTPFSGSYAPALVLDEAHIGDVVGIDAQIYTPVPFGSLFSTGDDFTEVSDGTTIGGPLPIPYTEVGTANADGVYVSYVGYVTFDTSALPAPPDQWYLAGMSGDFGGGNNDFNLQIALYDYGSLIEGDDWLNPTALSALTPIGTISSTSGINGQLIELDIGAFSSGTLRMVLYTDNQASGTPPLADSSEQVSSNSLHLVAKYDYEDPGVVGSWTDEITADTPDTWWRLGDVGPTAVDSSGNAKDGISTDGQIFGAPGLVVGDADTALQMSSSVPTSVSSFSYYYDGVDYSSTGLSVEALFESSDVTGNFGVVGLENGSTFEILTYRTDGDGQSYIVLDAANLGGDLASFVEAPVFSGTPTHVVGTIDPDGSNISLYVNGTRYVAVALGEAFTMPLTVQTSVLFYAGSNFTAMDGTIDETSLYAQTLTPERVAAHFKATGFGANLASLSDTVGITASFSAGGAFASLPDAVGITDSLSVQLVLSAHAYRDAVLTSTPDLFWEFDELLGTVAVDSSGNGNDGTYEGAVILGSPGLVSDTSGHSATFAAGVDVVSTTTFGPAVFDNFTFEAIVKPANLTSLHIIATLYGPSGTFLFASSGPQLVFQATSDDGSVVLLESGGGSLIIDAITHVAVTWDANTNAGLGELIIYADGVSVVSLTPPSHQNIENFNPSNFYAGGLTALGPYSFLGDLDEVAFYEHTLTPTEIADHVSAMSNAQAPVVSDTVGISAILTVAYSRPVITFITPDTGIPGDIVTITGTRLTGVVDVKIDALTPSYTIVDDTTITVEIPFPTSGSTVNIAIYDIDGLADSESFTYLRPTITLVSPTSGPANTRTLITITGQYFYGVTQVLFGSGYPAASLIIGPGDVLRVETPFHDAGAVTLSVVDTFGTAASTRFTFAPSTAPQPAVASRDGSGASSIAIQRHKVRPIKTNSIQAVSHSAVREDQATGPYQPRDTSLTAKATKSSISIIDVHDIHVGPSGLPARSTPKDILIPAPPDFYQDIPVYQAKPFRDSMFGLVAAGFTSQGTIQLYQVVPAPQLPTGWSIALYPSSIQGGVPNQAGHVEPFLPLSDTAMVCAITNSDFGIPGTISLVILQRVGNTIHLGASVQLPTGSLSTGVFGFCRVSDTEFVVGYSDDGIDGNSIILGCTVSGDQVSIASMSRITSALNNLGVHYEDGARGRAIAVNGTFIGYAKPGSLSFPGDWNEYYWNGGFHYDGTHLFGDGACQGSGFNMAWTFTISGGVTGVAYNCSSQQWGWPYEKPVASTPGVAESIVTRNAQWVALSWDGSTVIEGNVTSQLPTHEFINRSGDVVPYLLFGFISPGGWSYCWVRQNGQTLTVGPVHTDPFIASIGVTAGVRHANNIILAITFTGDLRGTGNDDGIYPYPASPATHGISLAVPFQTVPPDV